jgi:hypothetical protein
MAQQRARRVWRRVEEHSIAQSKAAVYARNEMRQGTASPYACSATMLFRGRAGTPPIWQAANGNFRL